MFLLSSLPMGSVPILLGIFFTLAMMFTQAWDEVPMTIYVTLGIWLISCAVIMKKIVSTISK